MEKKFTSIEEVEEYIDKFHESIGCIEKMIGRIEFTPEQKDALEVIDAVYWHTSFYKNETLDAFIEALKYDELFGTFPSLRKREALRNILKRWIENCF